MTEREKYALEIIMISITAHAKATMQVDSKVDALNAAEIVNNMSEAYLNICKAADIKCGMGYDQ